MPSKERKSSAQTVAQKVTGAQSGDPQQMLNQIRRGLRYSAVEELGDALCAPHWELSRFLSISSSTLRRRRVEGRLHTLESDRVVRFAALKDTALLLAQGDDQVALAWLRTPLDILGNETPLEHAMTEFGAIEVLDLIGRLRYGVFS